MIQRSAEFTVTRHLPPCKVDVQLLRDIEAYILAEVPNLIACSGQALADVLGITFEEQNGKLTLPTMQHHQGQYLPDEITKVEIAVVEHAIGLTLRLVFSNGKLGGRIEVTCKGLHCRENAEAISSGLYRVVNSRRNLRRLSARNEPVWLEVARLVSFAIGAILATTALVMAAGNSPLIAPIVRMGAIALTFIVFSALPGILPPFQFDHAGARNRDLVTIWTLGACAAALIGVVVQWVVVVQ